MGFVYRSVARRGRCAMVLVAAILLLSSVPASAQRIVPNPSGSDESSGARRSSIGLILETGLTNETSFYRESLFAPARDRLLVQVGPSAFGEVIAGRLSAYVLVPYVMNLGLVPDAFFPDIYQFESNHGLGDIRGGASVELLRDDDSAPLNVNVAIDIVHPSGTSRFESESPLPLGNGFRNLAIGAGASRRLGARALVFSSFVHVERGERTFASPAIASRSLSLSPDDIRLVRSGLGVIMAGTSLLSFQYERIDVGGVYGAGGAIVEEPLVVTRVGASITVNRGRGLNGSVFGGLELAGNDKRAVLSMAVPIVRIVGVDF